MKHELTTDNKSLDALVRDMKRAVSNHKYEVTPSGVVFGGDINFKAGGVFDINVTRSANVQKALDCGDEELVALLQDQIVRGSVSQKDFFAYDVDSSPNIMPTAGINYYLNLLLGDSAKKSGWYFSAFRNNVSPDDSWDANWAGASSGPKGQEVNAAYVTATEREPAVYSTPADSKSIASATVTYIVKAGVTGLSVYGGTVNSAAAFGYNTAYDGVDGEVLLAATLRSVAATGLIPADGINMAYALFGSST